MLSITKAHYQGDALFIEAVCKSTDAKPTSGIANGSQIVEMDTSKVYFFDAEESAWIEF